MNIYERAVAVWGKEPQMLQVIEEMSELTEEIVKNVNRKKDNIAELIEETADVEKLKLSDAFEVPKNDGEFEWTATLVNINKGHNESLLSKCKPLNDYATYIERIKANIKQGLSKEEAVDEAMDFAIKNNMLNGFFQNQKI